ncbi:MAG: hypothetical protein KGO49_06730 [Gammaproteobacteria bacterium]|nr:hypothetical protein [Gammaproteobacteria bacterium]
MIGTITGCLFGATLGYCTTSGLIPYTFSAGTPIVADQVNTNFQSLATAISNLQTTVGKLNGSVALTSTDLVGTYSMNYLQNELHGQTGSGGYAEVDSYTSGGTVTLNSDGTGTMTGINETGTNLTISGGNTSIGQGSVQGTAAVHASAGSNTFTWSYSGNNVALTIGSQTVNFTVVAGGKLLINSSNNPTDNTTKLITLAKTS